MRLHYIIILSLLVLPMVMASAGNLKIVSFTQYLDSKEVSNVDWDTDTILASPGQTVQLQLRMKNPYERTVELNFTGVLYLNGDIEVDDSKKDVEIDPEISKSATLSFFIPASTNYGYYDLELKYTYSTNETTDSNGTRQYVYSVSKDMQVHVQGQASGSGDNYMDNLTKALTQSIEEKNYLASLLYNESTCLKDKSELNGNYEKLKAECTVSTACMSDLKSEQTKSNDYKSQLDTCTEKVIHMKDEQQVTREVDQAKLTGASEQSRKDGSFYMAVGLAIAVVWFWQDRKKRIEGSQPNKPLKGRW